MTKSLGMIVKKGEFTLTPVISGLNMYHADTLLIKYLPFGSIFQEGTSIVTESW